MHKWRESSEGTGKEEGHGEGHQRLGDWFKERELKSWNWLALVETRIHSDARVVYRSFRSQAVNIRCSCKPPPQKNPHAQICTNVLTVVSGLIVPHLQPIPDLRGCCCQQ